MGGSGGGSLVTDPGSGGSSGAELQGPPSYGLVAYGEVLSCTTLGTHTQCGVDEEFLDALIEDSTPLWFDACGLELVVGGSVDVAGFYVRNCDDDSLIYAIGLRDGDVITEIEGTALTSFDAAYDISSALAADGADKVSGLYRRGGTTRQLTLERVDLSTYP